MILMISVTMMNVKHQSLAIPLSDSTILAMCITQKNPANVFSFKILRFYLCTCAKYFILFPVDKSTFIMPSVSDFRSAIIKMRYIYPILHYFPFQRAIVSADFRNREFVKTVKPAIRRSDRLLNTLLAPVISMHPFLFSQSYENK